MEKIPTFQYHYFLDEAGDPIFYGKSKKLIIGEPGVSHNFFLGMVKFNEDLKIVSNKVIELQKEVIDNPYFNNIGSINKKKSSHGFYFHATDDIPELNPESAVNTTVTFNVQDHTVEPLLNIADYFCWAVQRVFERDEIRYYDYLKDKIKVIDLYGTERAAAGKNIYTLQNPITEANKKCPSTT